MIKEGESLTYLGRRFRVLFKTKSEDEANAFMTRTEDSAVLTVSDDGTIFIASKSDKGKS